MGGLSRRAYQIKEIQSRENKPIILLDGGSLFFAKPLIAESLRPAKRIQAGGVSHSFNKMDYDAIGIAPLDLADGLDFLEQQYKEFTLPLLSANLTDPESNTPLFKPYTIKQIGDVSIGIIGLTGEQNTPVSDSAEEKYRVQDWQNRVPDTLDIVKKKADMIILLSSYPESVNRQIAKRFDNVHLIIQSGHSTINKAPQLIGNTLITQIGSRGKYMGRMDITWNSSHRWQQNILPQLRQEKDRLDRINWRLGRMEKRYQGQALQQSQAYKTLLLEKDGSTAEIIRLEKLAKKEQGKNSSFTSSFIPLNVALPEDPEIRDIVQQTKVAINSVGRKKLEQSQQRLQPHKKSSESIMSGWKKCRNCHPDQTDFWQKTQHAKAWQTLANAQQQFNQECLACHVTLPTYDMETVHADNLLANLPLEFHGVSCEACHGPGKAHTENPGHIRPRRPSAVTCLTCHTPDHDTNFNFNQKIKLIRCPQNH